jgi:hypothetical protein
MWAEKRDEGKVLAVMPSIDDMFDLKKSASEAVGERVGITQSDANIILRHLAAIESTPTTGKARAQLLADGDLSIYLSERDIADWPLTGIAIPRTSIETPMTDNERFRAGLLEAAIPEGGVLVDFSQMMTPRSHPHW